MKMCMSIALSVLMPAIALAHGAEGAGGAGEHAHESVGLIEAAIGLCIIVAIALVWAMARGKK